MDIEFHYYITYLIAAKAGFDPKDAHLLAYSCQYTDDNTEIFEISQGTKDSYKNHMSQTMDIINPQTDFLKIYPLFHFFPGDSCAECARRKDGKTHPLNTTPNSKNAQWMLNRALSTNNLYRIGIALHVFADTWAHQNFLGYHDCFNCHNPIGLTIGHADAGHNPDWPGLEWIDSRLVHERADNTNRFLEAAETCFTALRHFLSPSGQESTLNSDKDILRKDLLSAIGPRDQDNSGKEARIGRYVALACKKNYGGQGIPEFNEKSWFSEAVRKNSSEWDHQSRILCSGDPSHAVYAWQDPEEFEQTNWFQFEETVKAHQEETWGYLKDQDLFPKGIPNLNLLSL